MTQENEMEERVESKKEKRWYWCRWCRETMTFFLVIFKERKIWKCENCGTKR